MKKENHLKLKNEVEIELEFETALAAGIEVEIGTEVQVEVENDHHTRVCSEPSTSRISSSRQFPSQLLQKLEE